MDSLSVTFIGLLLGAFIPYSCATVSRAATWEEFEAKMKAGGAFMLELTVENHPNENAKTTEFCNKYSKVSCFYGVEKLKDNDDSFYKQFHNDITIIMIFYKGGVQVEKLDKDLTYEKVDAAFKKIST